MLTFLGTRGEIDAKTLRHRMHSALLVSQRRSAVMIDCGADWLRRVKHMHLDAILLTHAHPDHVGGLKNGAPCHVFATYDTWSSLHTVPAIQRKALTCRSPIEMGGVIFEAYPVEHSMRAPAVGYRITSGRHHVFYAPDLVRIYDRHDALAGIQLYIGDGASITRPIVRKRGNAFIGHASMRTQLEWCRDEGVGRAIFSHCGSEIVAGDEEAVAAKVRALGNESRVAAKIAYDGLRITLK